MEIVLAVVGLVAGVLIGVGGAFVLMRNSANGAISKSKAEAAETLNKAKAEAAELVKKAEVDAKAEYLRIKESADKEVETLRKELREQDQRLQKREDTLDRKLDTLGIKEKNLENLERSLTDRKKNVETKEKQLEETLAQQKDLLLRITTMSPEEARQLVLSRVENEIRHETAVLVQRIEDQAKEEAKTKSTNILLQAMQRYAAEVTSEGTTKSV
ncbi:MAG TPA: Rnase Y domain-containing protein, partial [Verrucomicrobiae bacterium]|nr:Rnase Y domain-containing protein [Verrucomicrobiae bacterium]